MTEPAIPVTGQLHENILFHFSGGLGKGICATAFLKALRKVHPEIKKLHVLSPWGDVFRELSCVDRSYDLNEPNPYFGEDHADFDMLEGEPYLRLGYRRGQDHLVDAWFRMFGLTLPEEKTGSVKVLEAEHREAMKFFAQTPRNKKWIAFQPFGAAGNQVRSFPVEIAQAIADKLKEKGFIVVHICTPEQPTLKDTIRTDPGKNDRGQQMYCYPRTLFAILNLCDGFVGVDSSMQHAWAALGKKAGIVCWGGTRPKNLGYPTNINLTVSACETPGCGRPHPIGDTACKGQVWACPYGEMCMKSHPPEKIVQELIKANGWEDYRPPEEKAPESQPEK